jgi:ABC-type polysaccharide/polyol phosphate export permease
MNQIDTQGDTTVRSQGLAPLESATERVIVPTKRRISLRDVAREGAVIRVLAGRDFKVKYKQSLLGPLWLIFQPLALLAGFLVAFQSLTDVKSAGVPYSVFALAGLSAWSYFQAAMVIGTASVISSINLVRFTPCPRPAFPIASLIASLPVVAITTAGAILVTTISGDLSWRVVLLPIGLTWLVLLTAGAVGITSALTVRYRDIASALPFLLQVGVFLTPVGYSIAQLSEKARLVIELNPLTGMVEGWRWMLISGYTPSLEPILVSVAITGLLAFAGWRVFTRLETTMADDI